jgi:cell division transport system permease protein
MIATFGRILGYGVQGFRRNIWLSLIAIITMTMTLLTMTSFALGDIVASKKYKEFSEQNIDYAIFLRDEASDADISLLRDQINSRPGVITVSFASKDDARTQFEQFFNDDPELRGVITEDNNPLPRELTVKFNDPNLIDSFNTFVRQDRFKDIVDKTGYQKNKVVIDNYVRTTNFLKIFGLSFTVFFFLIAILVILNTIRLTIYSRRSEIEVMRLVGATQGYIRGPFLVEGVLFGVISALAAALISWGVLKQIETLINQSNAAGTSNAITELFGSTLKVGNVSAVSSILAYLFMLQLAAGIALGIICSVLAIRRYLKE